MTKTPILISGGGLASLLLARCLLRYRVPFQLFERDASPSFRGQGYRLRLSAEGLDAIESVLGPEGFPKFWEATGKTSGAGLVRYNAVTGETTDDTPNEQPTSGGGQPTDRQAKEQLTSRGGQTIGIARGEMRKLFMEGCEPYIQWSKTVTGYERLQDGVRAIFADGTKSEEGSMLIGGEGIYSRVSKQLSNGALKVFDLGARGIHGQAPATSFKALGEGVFQLRDDTHPNGSVFVITNVRPGNLDEEGLVFGWTMGGTPGTIEAPNNNYSVLGKPAADLAKALTAKWHPKFRPLFENIIESDAAFWKITCSHPEGVPEWPNDPRVTVIGDAVHSMTPGGGIGANTAVRDSALLGRLIGEAGGYREGVTAEYEKVMRVYGSEAVAKSFGWANSQWGTSATLKELEGPRSGVL